MKLVKNWDQVYKSLAVWLPVLGSAIYQVLLNINPEQVPDNFQTPLVLILGVLGWIIKQPGIRTGVKK